MQITLLSIYSPTLILMKQTRKTTRNGQSNRKGSIRRVRIISLHPFCGIDQAALDVLMVVTNPSTPLFIKVYNALLGFDATVQGYMAEAVALYYAGQAHTYTNLPSVDAVLENLYKVIDAALAKGM